MSNLAILRGRLMEDPSISKQNGNIVVTIDVMLDAFNEEAPKRRTFTYVETEELNGAKDIKQFANSLATQMMFSKKGNKVFIQAALDKTGEPEEKIFSYYDQLTQNGKNVK